MGAGELQLRSPRRGSEVEADHKSPARPATHCVTGGRALHYKRLLLQSNRMQETGIIAREQAPRSVTELLPSSSSS